MIGVQSTDVPRLWPNIRHLVNAALKHGNGEFEESDIFEALIKANMQLWWGDETILITEIVVYPRKKACIGFLAGGNLEQIKKGLPMIELWAKAQGCEDALIYGRPGWKRAMADRGYVQKQVHLRKTL